VRARNEERRQLRSLFRDASRLQRAMRLREFIAAVEDRAHRDGELTPEKKPWIEWAKAKADWIDPLVRRSDPGRPGARGAELLAVLNPSRQMAR